MIFFKITVEAFTQKLRFDLCDIIVWLLLFLSFFCLLVTFCISDLIYVVAAAITIVDDDGFVNNDKNFCDFQLLSVVP